MRIGSFALSFARSDCHRAARTSRRSRRADYNITGSWIIEANTAPCKAFIQETLIPNSDTADLVISPGCNFYGAGAWYGTIYLNTGVFNVSGTTAAFIIASMTGQVSDGGHTISGSWLVPSLPPASGTIHGTGGSGDPKPYTMTPTDTIPPIPTATQTPTSRPTPQSVGGVAVDVPTSGGTSDARWLFALASASLAALGGGAVYARRRG